jgi:hypothetical protein
LRLQWPQYLAGAIAPSASLTVKRCATFVSSGEMVHAILSDNSMASGKVGAILQCNHELDPRPAKYFAGVAQYQTLAP